MRGLKIDWSEPGAPLSAAAHVGLLVAIIVGFAASPRLPDSQESIPVETISDAQFNQIMKGEKTAKALATPQLRVDKVTAVEIRKPAPPTPQAKLDVPAAAPPQVKPATDAADDPLVEEAPPPAKAAAAPAPPSKPVEKPVAQHDESKPKPAARQNAPDATKPPSPNKDEAEVIERAKPPKPTKVVAKTPDPLPKPHVAEPKPVADATPDSKVKPDPKPKNQTVAKLEEKKLEELAADPTPKPVPKPKKRRAKPKPVRPSEDALADAKDFLAKDTPQSTASTGRKLTQTASLGAPDATAQKLNPFWRGKLLDLMKEQYLRCLSNPGLQDEDYIPTFKIRFNPDWSQAATPVLINKPRGAKQRALADSAMRAVNNPECNPLHIPLSYFKYWTNEDVQFDVFKNGAPG